MATVHRSVEGARGCGHRKGGGIYLVAGGITEPCDKLPVELHACPTCGGGVHQTRGFTWILPDPLLDPGPHGHADHDAICPLGDKMLHEHWSHGERAGLIWIGAAFYSSPQAFMNEAVRMGVSRRLAQVPRDLVIGETWVALAHPKAIPGECEHGAPAGFPCANCPKRRSTGEYRGGVITFFKPSALEYVVKGTETEAELDALERRGFRLVDVVKVGADVALDDDGRHHMDLYTQEER